MTLRTAAPDDLDVLLDLAVAFYEEDGFTTPRPGACCHDRCERTPGPFGERLRRPAVTRTSRRSAS
jgi:hypothetical protein